MAIYDPTLIFAALGLSDTDLANDVARETKKLGSGAEAMVRDRTARHLHDAVVRGLPSSVLRVLRDYGFTNNEISTATGIPMRTITRRNNEKRLDLLESNQVVRLAACMIAANTDAFPYFFDGTDALREAFRSGVTWMRKPHRALAKSTPLAFIATEAGLSIVKGVLNEEQTLREARAVSKRRRGTGAVKRRKKKS